MQHLFWFASARPEVRAVWVPMVTGQWAALCDVSIGYGRL